MGGDGKLNGVYQFNTQYRKAQMCNERQRWQWRRRRLWNMCGRRWELSLPYKILQRRKCESSVQEDVRSLRNVCRHRCELPFLYKLLQRGKCESSVQEDVRALLIRQCWRWRRQLTALRRPGYSTWQKDNYCGAATVLASASALAARAGELSQIQSVARCRVTVLQHCMWTAACTNSILSGPWRPSSGLCTLAHEEAVHSGSRRSHQPVCSTFCECMNEVRILCPRQLQLLGKLFEFVFSGFSCAVLALPRPSGLTLLRS